MLKVAVIPGHTMQKKGAYSKQYNLHEYDWAAAVVEEMTVLALHINSLSLKPFHRKETGKGTLDAIRALAGRVNEFNPDLVLEFHCNSFGDPSANGHETLVWATTADTNKKFAKRIDQLQGMVFENRARQRKGYIEIKKGGRGWPLFAYCKAPVILLEPGFLSNPEEAGKLIHNRGKFSLDLVELLEIKSTEG